MSPWAQPGEAWQEPGSWKQGGFLQFCGLPSKPETLLLPLGPGEHAGGCVSVRLEFRNMIRFSIRVRVSVRDCLGLGLGLTLALGIGLSLGLDLR